MLWHLHDTGQLWCLLSHRLASGGCPVLGLTGMEFKSAVNVRYWYHKTLWFTIKAMLEKRECGRIGFEVVGWSNTGQVEICLWGVVSNLIYFACFLLFAVLFSFFIPPLFFWHIKLPLSWPMRFFAFTLPVFSTHLAGDGSRRTAVCTAGAGVKPPHMDNMKKIAGRGCVHARERKKIWNLFFLM